MSLSRTQLSIVKAIFAHKGTAYIDFNGYVHRVWSDDIVDAVYTDVHDNIHSFINAVERAIDYLEDAVNEAAEHGIGHWMMEDDLDDLVGYSNKKNPIDHEFEEEPKQIITFTEEQIDAMLIAEKPVKDESWKEVDIWLPLDNTIGILEQIDAALDRKDKEEFMRLTAMLQN